MGKNAEAWNTNTENREAGPIVGTAIWGHKRGNRLVTPPWVKAKTVAKLGAPAKEQLEREKNLSGSKKLFEEYRDQF